MKITKTLSDGDKLRIENVQLRHENNTLKQQAYTRELEKLQTDAQDLGKELVTMRTEFSVTYGIVPETMSIRRDGTIEGEFNETTPDSPLPPPPGMNFEAKPAELVQA